MSDPTKANGDNRKVAIVPCSGIGKTYGSVTREAAYEITESLYPEQSQLVPLSMLVLGSGDAQTVVSRLPAITIDGCKLACARKMVEESGGQVAHEVAVLDAYRRHRRLKPQGIAELNEEGQELARVMAEEIAVVIDQLLEKES